MSITIHLEIGHDASLRTKTTPEGFTHDWEVYVRGCNGSEIHYYVEKVVFHLHETFPKPKRVVKEPPFALRTSGYAGFNLPIEIYLRNNEEPKKIRFNYDLQLQPTGPPIHKVQKEKFVFHSPSEEFRTKLLKGGAVVGSAGSTQDNHSDSRIIDEKNQMTSKPKLSGSEVAKKHKMKLEEPRTTDFLNLFGTPITKTSKTPEPPKQKDVPKSSSKPEKSVEKDKNKSKNTHKEKDKSKDKERFSENADKKIKDEKKKSKEDRSKDRDRSKEKSSSKKEKEREKSPPSQPRSSSPKRSPKRSASPLPQSQKHNSTKEKDTSKEERREKDRKEEKKSKKEKREHKDSKHKERDKEKDHKEHKSRESKSSKEASSVKEKDASPAPAPVVTSQSTQKTEKKPKEKEPLKDIPKDEEKHEKSRSEKSDDKQKHKHKKKDRKEKREEKHSKSEKKSDKPASSTASIKEEVKESPVPVSSSRDTDKSHLFGSPKSEPPSTPSQSEPPKPVNNLASFIDEDSSNDSMVKVSSREPSPVHRAPSKSLSPSPLPADSVKQREPDKKGKEPSPKKKEKKEKKKEKKSDREHDKKRKRKSDIITPLDIEQPPEKVAKEEENNNSDDERKVSSTEDANPPPKNEAEDYMGMLRDLQHKIMGLKDNSDLQKVVQLIAETGRYEVSAHTFDFDLCLLDRSTVRQLQDFFSSIS